MKIPRCKNRTGPSPVSGTIMVKQTCFTLIVEQVCFFTLQNRGAFWDQATIPFLNCRKRSQETQESLVDVILKEKTEEAKRLLRYIALNRLGLFKMLFTHLSMPSTRLDLIWAWSDLSDSTYSSISAGLVASSNHLYFSPFSLQRQKSKCWGKTQKFIL